LQHAGKERAEDRANKYSFSPLQRIEPVTRIEEPDSGLYLDIAVRFAEKEAFAQGDICKSPDCPTWVKHGVETLKVQLHFEYAPAIVFALQGWIRESVNEEMND